MLQPESGTDATPLDANTRYQLDELTIALDPLRPEHILPDLTPARVGIVDVGCGIGQLFVAKDGELPHDVPRYGFDIDASLIAYANEHWPQRGRFDVCSAEALPLPDASVDFYVSRVTLPYSDIPAALDEAARVLVPGGHLWITLHPVSMTLQELDRATGHGRLREAAGRAVVLLNGLAFHLFGRNRHYFGVRDSWQSVFRMKRALVHDFTDIRVNKGRHFLIEATRR